MTCHNIDGAFQHSDVNIGWYPCVAVRTTELRSKPGAGVLLATLEPGDGFARQSVRNPSCSSTPPPRASTHYLHAGDEVTVLISDGPQGFHFVQVVKTTPDASARPGMRGWVLAETLERKATT